MYVGWEPWHPLFCIALFSTFSISFALFPFFLAFDSFNFYYSLLEQKKKWHPIKNPVPKNVEFSYRNFRYLGWYICLMTRALFIVSMLLWFVDCSVSHVFNIQSHVNVVRIVNNSSIICFVFVSLRFSFKFFFDLPYFCMYLFSLDVMGATFFYVPWQKIVFIGEFLVTTSIRLLEQSKIDILS